jgi:hypothetical protein
MQKIKYIYAGLDPETPIVLSKNEYFELIAVYGKREITGK